MIRALVFSLWSMALVAHADPVIGAKPNRINQPASQFSNSAACSKKIGLGACYTQAFRYPSPTLTQSTSLANGPPWRGINQGGIGFGTNFDSIPLTIMQPYYASRGFNVARFPIGWEQMQRSLCTAVTTLDAGELANLDATVAAVTAAGMDIIIDLHSYGNYNYTYAGRTCASPPDNGAYNNTTTSSYFVNFWTQIATRYKTNPKVIFDLMNEPYVVTAAQANAESQLAITAIRGAGATTQYIMVEYGGDFADCRSISATTGALFKTLTDAQSKLILECHNYWDSNNSGATGPAVQGAALNRISAATTYAASNSIKLFFGEFGIYDDPTSFSETKVALDYIAANPTVWVGWSAWGGGPNWPLTYQFIMEPQNYLPLIDLHVMRLLSTYAAGKTWSAGGGAWPWTAKYP
jgi:endoglucanase